MKIARRKTEKIVESHPAIISRGDFERVQQMKVKRSRKEVDCLSHEQHDEQTIILLGKCNLKPAPEF
ncbi:MAG: hypothetical protein ACI4AL_12515 [Aristaeellaceae bacterium]